MHGRDDNELEEIWDREQFIMDESAATKVGAARIAAAAPVVRESLLYRLMHNMRAWAEVFSNPTAAASVARVARIVEALTTYAFYPSRNIQGDTARMRDAANQALEMPTRDNIERMQRLVLLALMRMCIQAQKKGTLSNK